MVSPEPSVDMLRRADTIIRAAAIHSMASDHAIYQSLGIQGERIVAVSPDPHGLDSLISEGAHAIDVPDLTLLPAFNDSHNHLIMEARGISQVQPDLAHSISELLDLIRERAAKTPPGGWIQTATGWDESNLQEKRLPTASELDQAVPDHPVWVQRGGHIGSANSRALHLAGITQDTIDPQFGKIVRGSDGSPTGELIAGPAMSLVQRQIPPASFDQQVDDLRQACQLYNSYGIGSVRDPIVTRDQLRVYQALYDERELTLRCQVMFPIKQGTVQERLADIQSLGIRSGFGDDWLKVWGLKTLMDGGPQSAALDDPFADRPEGSGTPYWLTADLVQVLESVVGQGWRVGIHAIGDRAVRQVLDAYEAVIQQYKDLRPGTLVIEHAFLANVEQRTRAAHLGVGITVQHPLLYAQGAALLHSWGAERTRQIMPVRSWIESGALLAAGSDCPPSDFNPLLAVWGMATRGTRQIGIQGPGEAIDRFKAIQLYTVGSACLNWEDDRKGMIQPGKLADLVAYPVDPFACPVDDLVHLKPAFTMVGGQWVYDPNGISQ